MHPSKNQSVMIHKRRLWKLSKKSKGFILTLWKRNVWAEYSKVLNSPLDHDMDPTPLKMRKWCQIEKQFSLQFVKKLILYLMTDESDRITRMNLVSVPWIHYGQMQRLSLFLWTDIVTLNYMTGFQVQVWVQPVILKWSLSLCTCMYWPQPVHRSSDSIWLLLIHSPAVCPASF